MKSHQDFSDFPAKYETLLLLFLGVLVFLIYASTLTGPFIFDDKHNIQQNPYIRLERLSPGGIAKAALESPSKHRPVANISFALNYYFHRYNPVGYHFVNILIHIINGTLLYLFTKATLLTPALKTDYDRFAAGWIPVFTAFIWTLHPLQTQSVSYIVQRMNGLATLFYLSCLWFYAKYRLSKGTKRSSWLLAGYAASGVLAFGSKEIAASLPVFIILYEWYFFQGLRPTWFKKKIPFIAGAIMLLVILSLLFLGSDPLGRITTGYVHHNLTIAQRVLTEFRVVIFYLSLLIWPHPSRLNLDHEFLVSNSLIDPLTTLFSLAAIAGAVGAAIYFAKKAPLISFCILWFFGNLVIESSVIGLEIIFEHRTYLPSLMLILMLASLAFKYIKPRQLCIPVLCILVAVGTLWTYQRNKVWGDAITLWLDCVVKSPNKARPYNNLGVALAYAGQSDAAIDNYYAALKINPDYGNAHYNLGSILARKGHLKSGIAHMTKALELEPNNYEAHNNLGIALLIRGEPQKAATHFRKALEINANYASAHNNLGIAMRRQHNLSEAIFHFQEALRLDPANAEAHNNLGNAYRGQGKFKAAKQHFNEALRINPGYEAARKNYEENQRNLK
jgi:tetratricopeptide (TPR) repeat protein